MVCCVGDFKGKTVHTFVMCAHFPDVHTLHLMLHVDNWLFPIHTSTNHCSTKGALSKLIATVHATYYIIDKVPFKKL